MENKKETIEIVSEDIVYKRIEKVFELDFKGHTFIVNKWWIDEGHSGDYDNDYEITEKESYEKLTEEEQEELEDFIFDLT